jgi:2-polyprenyl-6-methoxyphenol hydroxylase-like FAD-dependent oxidoreductase
MSDSNNNSAQHSTVDVIIVGGGPVGMGLAIELGQRNIRCVVVERYLEPQRIPKGQNLTQRTMEHFHFWGAEKRLRAARTIPPEYGIGGLTAYGTLLGPHYDWLQRELVKSYYFTTNERLPQYATEAVLRRRVSELNCVETIYGWDAQEIQQDADGVSLTVTNRGDAGSRVLRAAYVVGCDGSRSLIREQAGITQTRTDHDRMMVLLVFKSEELHELLKCYPGKSYYNVLHPSLKGYWKFFGRVDLGSTWFFHAPVPPGTTKDNFDFAKYLHDAVGTSFHLEFEHIGFWDLRFMLANTYREGRIFVAGDAAHSHPPYGGYGVNSGLEDARNLGWKLASRIQGWGSEALLDSYDAERRPVFKSTISDFIAKSIETDRDFVATYDPIKDKAGFDKAWSARAAGAVGEVHAFEPHYEGSPVVWLGNEPGKVCSALGSHQYAARPGHHLAPATLSSGKNVYETFGPGFTLVAINTDNKTIESFRDVASQLGVPLVVVEESLASEAIRYEAKLILIRPDNFVAWSTTETNVTGELAREVLTKATGR